MYTTHYGQLCVKERLKGLNLKGCNKNQSIFPLYMYTNLFSKMCTYLSNTSQNVLRVALSKWRLILSRFRTVTAHFWTLVSNGSSPHFKWKAFTTIAFIKQLTSILQLQNYLIYSAKQQYRSLIYNKMKIKTGSNPADLHNFFNIEYCKQLWFGESIPFHDYNTHNK